MRGLQYFAKKIGKTSIYRLKKEDFQGEIGSSYCWAYEFPKQKRLTHKEAEDRARDKPGVSAFPCQYCLHWHLGSTPFIHGDEGDYAFVEAVTSPLEFEEKGKSKKRKCPPKAHPEQLAKLQERRSKYV